MSLILGGHPFRALLQLRRVTAITSTVPPGVVNTKSGDSPKAQVGGGGEIWQPQAGLSCLDLLLILFPLLRDCFRKFLQPISCIPVSSSMVCALGFTGLLCCTVALLMLSQKLSEVLLSLGKSL